MELEWQPLPPTSANPDALIGAAGTLESMAAEAGTTGDRVSGILHSGVPDFSSLLGPPIMNRSTEHGILARSAQRLLTYAASVTRAWAADVTEYIARRNQILAARQQYDPDPTQVRPTGETTEIMLLNRETVQLVHWFEEQARLRGAQLRDGPTPDRLSELGRAHEFHGLAARTWDSWEPPALRAGGVDMPALVRRWQDGAATGPEAAAAAEWHADYQEWRERLLAGGRYLNAEDLAEIRRYEDALTAAGLTAAVVAGRLSARRESTEFRGWQWERKGGYEDREGPLPLAERRDPVVSVEVGETTRPRFEHSDERYAQFRSADDHRRDWFVDAQAGGVFEGLDDAGLTTKTGAGFEAGWRTGAVPIDEVPGSTKYTFGSVSANGSASLSLDPDRIGAYGEAGAEATLVKISNDRLVEAEWGPLSVNGGGEVGVGAGATAQGGVYLEDGKLHVGWKLGAKAGIGGKAIVNAEVDLEEVVDLLTPWDEPKPGGGSGGGSF